MCKLFTVCLLSVAHMLCGQVKPDAVWMNQKFSMFIHFGLYSELGGVWNGKPVVNGYSEQILAHAGIFSDWYAAVAGNFNPVKWNADSIVTLAKAAGMRSIVFTAKHHDGFCMYHSQYTAYNIVDATPFGRDVMKELAEACRRQGIHFGVYFSLIDWHFPQACPISSHNADFLTPEHYEYNRKQVAEIMTAYGAVSEIWFDMGALTPEQSRGLYDLVNELQPHCMVSGRLGNDCGDFSVMGDNEYPDYKIGVPWQTAASFFDETWGYRSWQERGGVDEKVNEKIKSLIKVVSRGGNYLLNIGPEGDGSVVPFEDQVLHKMGQWLKKYGEGIYNVTSNPFDRRFEWGDVTQKGRKLYLFVDRDRRPDRIRLEGMRSRSVHAAYVGGERVKVAKEKGEWTICPQENRRTEEGPVDVICVELSEDYRIEPVHHVVKGQALLPDNAVPLYAYSSMDYYTGFQSIIAYTWGFNTLKSTITPWIVYTENEKGKSITVQMDGDEQELTLVGGETELVPYEGVRFGDVYRKSSGSVFGRIPVKESGEDVRDVNSEWKKWENFCYGERLDLPMPERSSILLLQEIESDKEQDILVGIGSGNGIQILLNGVPLTIHTSIRGMEYHEEVVLLPLMKGINQLVLKLYNRYEKMLCFSINPDIPQGYYRLQMSPFVLEQRELHQCLLQLSEPLTRNSAMRLNNLKITF